MFYTSTQNNYEIQIPNKFNGYTVHDLIEKGGTSAVLLVEKEDTKELFAAKVISISNEIQQNNLANVQREISIMEEISHPNIVQYFESFSIFGANEEEYLVIIMEYCENGDLLTFIDKNGFQSELEKKRIFLEFLSAVQYLHKKGIFHGDIKCENLLLGKDLTVKLCDFGFSGHSMSNNDRKARSGTIYYAAPELFCKGNYNPIKSDIWAIAMTLYTLSELKFPFEDGDDYFIANQIISKKFSRGNYMNEEFWTLFQKCTMSNPDSRPSVDDIIHDDYFNIVETDLPTEFFMEIPL